MSIANQLPTGTPSLGPVLRAIVRHRSVQATVGLWVIGHLLVLALAHGSLPFDRPAVAHLPLASQMAVPTVSLIEIFVLMMFTFLLTRRRVVPDIAARTGDRCGRGQRGASGSCLVAATTGCSRSYVGSVFGRTGRFDQFSTFSPSKRAKSLLLVVASTSPCT